MTTSPIPHADAVVIGGGILGCCAAYHLHQAGMRKIVLIERAPELATEISWAGAGFAALWSACAAGATLELELEHYALKFYQELADQQPIGLKRIGMVWVAQTSAGAARQAQQFAAARRNVGPNDVHLLTPEQVSVLVPIVTPSHITSGIHWPTALRVDVPLATRALGRMLTAAGVQVCCGVTATDIIVSSARVQAVQTSAGVIATGCVINAAGAWAGQVARMVGAALPLLPLPVARFVTAPIAGVPADLPLLMFPEYHNMYMREDDGGLLIGSDQLLAHTPNLVEHIRSALSTSGADTARPHISAHIADLHDYHEWNARAFAPVIPLLRDFAVKDTRSGLAVRTLDQRHMLGGVPGIEGCYVLGGDNEIGVTHGPGLGRLLAELVTTGKTRSDISAYRVGRAMG